MLIRSSKIRTAVQGMCAEMLSAAELDRSQSRDRRAGLVASVSGFQISRGSYKERFHPSPFQPSTPPIHHATSQSFWKCPNEG